MGTYVVDLCYTGTAATRTCVAPHVVNLEYRAGLPVARRVVVLQATSRSGPPGAPGPAGPPGVGMAVFFDPHLIGAVVGTERWTAPDDLTIGSVIVTAGSPATGVIDVLMDGVSILDAAKADLAGGQFVQVTPAVTAFPALSYLTVNGVSGDTLALTVQVVFV